MSYDLAIKEFQTLIDEVVKAKNKAGLTVMNVDIAPDFIRKCEILVSNFYPITDYQFTLFSRDIRALSDSQYNSFTKLGQLQSLAENIVKDVKLKKSIADEKGKDKTNEVELIKINKELQFATEQVREFRAVVAAKMKELDELKNTKQQEIDRIRNDYQNQIHAIKDTYQKEIDNLRNAPRGFNYKIWFHVVRFLLLSVLTFGVPYLLESMNWKYIIGIELAIIFSVLMFYFRNVPGWVQFLVATVLAILAIFFT